MNTLLVTSTEEGTGKTAIGIAIAKLAQEQDISVGYFKPKGTRVKSAVGKTRDDDPLLAADLLDVDADPTDLEPIVYSPTFVQAAIRGREDPERLRDRVQEAYESVSADRDLMVVEGGANLWTGGIVDLTDPAIADMLDARVVLVTTYEKSTDLDEILGAVEGLGDRLLGVLFNVVGDDEVDELTDDVIPFLENRGIETLGVLPREPSLAGVTVGELADQLGAKILAGDAETDVLVERFTVGAMGSDGALEHFRRYRNAAVITGADRADMQTAALEAPGVNCLVLTGGYTPSGSVLGKATERNVPVMLVQSDTRTTIDRTEAALRTGPTRSEKTVDRMVELLTDGIDVDRLLDSA